ncbi:PTS sugar transporter subunit IIB [Nocardiopsis trehalosi]|jgi:PTS system ascorbate-specific IIB component|uniref:PTS sugar transporter subunit IIB n=1 Tax=Nocardiopsis trehalosi TaxID=109329 RepID=UPI0008363744|nr:PTS sugar transporter subunit IIB [Nocardiopsis trehalosi]
MSSDRPLHVLTVCGVGMGSSLILKMTAEDAFRELGVAARVENTDISSARGMTPDIVIGQGMHTSELGDLAPVVLAVDNFLDKEPIVAALRERLPEHGWL